MPPAGQARAGAGRRYPVRELLAGFAGAQRRHDDRVIPPWRRCSSALPFRRADRAGAPARAGRAGTRNGDRRRRGLIAAGTPRLPTDPGGVSDRHAGLAAPILPPRATLARLARRVGAGGAKGRLSCWRSSSGRRRPRPALAARIGDLRPLFALGDARFVSLQLNSMMSSARWPGPRCPSRRVLTCATISTGVAALIAAPDQVVTVDPDPVPWPARWAFDTRFLAAQLR